MKSALLATLILTLGSFAPQALAADPVEHDSVCVAVYINGTGVPNGGTYPNTIKSGEKFHAEIKMKNTGSKSWLKSQNYALGKNDDGLQWGQNRINLPSTSPVVSGSDVVFASDLVNLHNTTSKSQFWWGMLRERTETNTEEGGNQVLDPGGRFGQSCLIYLNIEGKQATPAAETPAQPETPRAPKEPAAPNIKTSTMCTDPQKGTREISASWNGYGASSVRVFLKDGTRLVDQSPCLGSGTQNYTFTKMASTNNIFKVSLMPYTDSTCSRADLAAPTGGYYANVNNGGFGYPNMSIDTSSFGIKTIYFDIDGRRSYYTCAPLEFSLSVPTGKTLNHSFDVPINILLTRYAQGQNGTIQRNDINTSHPVIIRYRPTFQSEEDGSQKAPAPVDNPRTNPTNQTEKVGEP